MPRSSSRTPWSGAKRKRLYHGQTNSEDMQLTNLHVVSKALREPQNATLGSSPPKKAWIFLSNAPKFFQLNCQTASHGQDSASAVVFRIGMPFATTAAKWWFVQGHNLVCQ